MLIRFCLGPYGSSSHLRRRLVSCVPLGVSFIAVSMYVPCVLPSQAKTRTPRVIGSFCVVRQSFGVAYQQIPHSSPYGRVEYQRKICGLRNTVSDLCGPGNQLGWHGRCNIASSSLPSTLAANASGSICPPHMDFQQTESVPRFGALVSKSYGKRTGVPPHCDSIHGVVNNKESGGAF